MLPLVCVSEFQLCRKSTSVTNIASTRHVKLGSLSTAQIYIHIFTNTMHVISLHPIGSSYELLFYSGESKRIKCVFLKLFFELYQQNTVVKWKQISTKHPKIIANENEKYISLVTAFFQRSNHLVLVDTFVISSVCRNCIFIHII